MSERSASGYDGSIRINTKIDTKKAEKQVLQFEKEMEKSAKRVDALRSKMDKLASVKIPTQDYKDVTKQIADAEKKLGALNDRMAKFVELGGKTNSKQYKSMQYDMAELENTIAYAKGELEDLVETGKAFTLGKENSEYIELEKQFAEEQARLNQLSKQYAEAQANLNHSMNMDTVAKGFGKVSGAAKKTFLTIQKGASGTWRWLKKTGSVIGSLIRGFARLAGRSLSMFSGIGKESKRANNSLSRFSRRILELAKSAFIFNLLSAGFRKLTSGIGDAFQVYLGYDASLKNSINGLRAQLAALQGSLASAFAPIISAAVPYLSTLISWATAATNAVAAFIATLMGKTSYKKAVANVGAIGAAADDTAGSLGSAAAAAEELEKALGHYDELNVINQNDSSGGSGGSGGGGGAASAGDITYEDVEISAAISDFAEKVKEAWQKSDFTEVGAIIGGKLEDALDSVPWDSIQLKAQKIGKSLATLINGFVETSGLGGMVGLTVAEAINTGILGVEQFTGNLHFESIGQFIADGIVGALDELEWDSLTNIADDIGQGLAKFLNKVMTPRTFSSVGTALAGALNTVVSGAYSFLSTADFSQYGAGIADGINDFVIKADWNKIGRTIGKGLQKALDFFVGLLGSLKWSDIKAALQELWEGIAEEVDMSQVGQILLTAFSIWMTLNAAKGIGKIISQTVLGNIISSLLGVSAGTSMEIAATSFATNLASKLSAALGSAAILGIIAGGVALIKKGVNDMLDDPDTWINNGVEDYIEENPGALGEGAETPEIEVTITGDNEPLKDEIDDAVSYANETLPNETSVEINVSSINIPEKLKEISGISVIANKVLPGTGTIMTGLAAIVSTVSKATGMNSLEGVAASIKKVMKSGNPVIQGIMATVLGVEKQSGGTLQLKDVVAYARSAGWMTDANKKLQIDAIAKAVGWDKNPNKQVTVSAFTKEVSWAKNADKTKNVTAYTKLINWAKGADTTKTVTAYTNGISWLRSASRVLSGITGYVNSVQKQTGASLILRGITGAISAIFGKASGGIYQNGVWSTIPQKANSGIFSMNAWKNIPKYATGGTPHGTMFVAGEAGPEIVGHVGGRTEVLNKSQIASAIYSAVMAAMNESINNLAKAVLQHMTECTNTVIANMGYIVNSIQSAANASLPPVQFAGMPVGYIPDTNRTNAAYQSSYTGGTTIDYDKLAGAVANRISGNIQLENIMYMDKDIVYRKMVEVDRSVIKQTGHSGFGK